MTWIPPLPPAHRGAPSNPPNRFEALHLDHDPTLVDSELDPEPERPALPTTFYKDVSRSIISTNTSPDLGFDCSINPYRGCEHGCVYCYARPTHEFLGWSSGLDFETKIMVKEQAPDLLRRELTAPGWVPRTLVMSGVTDPYQPVERRLQLTRRCLEVLAELRHPVSVITKSALVVRDLDLLAELAQWNAVSLTISLTTLDETLWSRLEPRTAPPLRRLAVIQAAAEAGVPVGVSCAPLIPGLTDHEIPALLQAAAKAGARFAGYSVVRLPHAVKDLFFQWLQHHYPERTAKVRAHLRMFRGGQLTASQFHSRLKGEGLHAEQLESLFRVSARRAGLNSMRFNLSAEHFKRPGPVQMEWPEWGLTQAA